jgi:hypothetical protein
MAMELVEGRALTLVERRTDDPALLASVRLGLAQALWRLNVDPARARALAAAARDGWVKIGRRGERGLENAVDSLRSMR